MDLGQKTSDQQWVVTGSSVRGASHERTGACNQDALRWTELDCLPGGILMAVADGHGSKRSHRSEKGAGYAVGAAVSAGHDFFTPARLRLREEEIVAGLRESFARDVLDRWEALVRRDLRQHPLPGANGTPGTESYLVYGSTCLCTAITPRLIAHVQVGDGDILHVSETGEVTRPLPPDLRHIANETTSLCSPDAQETARVALVDITGQPAPAMILLATDGYANSFRDEAGFLQVATDVWDLIREDGFEAVAADLASWLAEASERGSGDDITVSLAVRRDALQPEGRR